MPAPKLAFIALLLMPLAAHAAPSYVARLVGPFYETEAVDVKVSGSVIVGVSSINASSGQAMQRLYLQHAPSPLGRQVCLTVQSRDGVYYSRNTFELPAESVGSIVHLPYNNSSRLDKLAKYGREDLAISATARSCERSSNEYYVLDDATAAKSPESIRVFVNSFGATDVFYSAGANGEASSCQLIGEGRRTSFDFWCDLPWPRGGGKLDVKIHRERYGREMPAATLTLFLKSDN